MTEIVEIDDQPSLPQKYTHHCNYQVLRGTKAITAYGRKWTERCWCKRMVIVDCKYIVAGSNIPAITKYWFDRDGNLERTTGLKA